MTPSQAAEGVPTLEEQIAWLARTSDSPIALAILASLRRLSTQNTEGLTDKQCEALKAGARELDASASYASESFKAECAEFASILRTLASRDVT